MEDDQKEDDQNGKRPKELKKMIKFSFDFLKSIQGQSTFSLTITKSLYFQCKTKKSSFCPNYPQFIITIIFNLNCNYCLGLLEK